MARRMFAKKAPRMTFLEPSFPIYFVDDINEGECKGVNKTADGTTIPKSDTGLPAVILAIISHATYRQTKTRPTNVRLLLERYRH